MIDDVNDFSLPDDDETSDGVEWSDGDNSEEDDLSDMLGFDLSGADAHDRSGLFALINSALVPQHRLPMLDVVFDRASRLMTTNLRHTTNDNVEITLDDISATRFGDFILSLPTQSVIAVLKSPELDNYCLLVVDAELVFSIVDLLLGGAKGAMALTIENRGFTTIELSITEKILSAIASDIATAFEPVTKLSFQLDRIETTPRFAAIAQDASVCTMAKYKVDMDGRLSLIHI